jgi:hypothetical protein
MRTKWILSSFTIFSLLAVLVLQVGKSTQKARYSLDFSSINKATQNIRKLTLVSPIRYSVAEKRNVAVKTAKQVSKKTITKKIVVKNQIVKPLFIKKEINPFDLKTKKMIIKKEVVAKVKVNLKEKIEIVTSQPVELKPIKVEKVTASNWVASYKPFTYKEEKMLLAKTSRPITDVKKKIRQINLPIKEKVVVAKKEEKLINEDLDKMTKETLDRISTALAATEKSNQEKVVDQKSNNTVTPKVEDDMVFFDYSAPDLNINEIAEIKSEANVKKVKPIIKKDVSIVTASQIVKQQPKANVLGKYVPEKRTPKKVVPQRAPTVKTPPIPVVTDAKSNNKMTTQNELIAKLFEERPEEKQIIREDNVGNKYKSEYSLMALGVDVNKKKAKISNFEIRFADDRDDILQDFGSGKIQINQLLNSEISIRRGTLFASDFYPTVVDFVFEGNVVTTQIPMLSRDKMKEIIYSNGITGLGGHVLVELDDMTEDVDLDGQFEKKLFLDRNYKVVDRGDSEYSHILFVGVTPGNTILSFRTYKNEITSKIVHVTNEYVYFDTNFYVEMNAEKFDLYEENLLSKTTNPLSIEPDEMMSFSFESKISKKAFNQYEVTRSVYPLGTRKYYELKHLNESIFIGYWDKRTIDVPSENYMRFVLDSFNIRTVKSQCLVQLNLSKNVKNISFDGDNGNGPMRINHLILDKDGVFYDEFGQNTSKVFLLGEEQGIINIKVDYVDKSSDYLQTFCSDSTYLVEQL